MFIIKALGRLCLLPFKTSWFILKTLVYICTFFQYDPWKRSPLQQLRDLEFRQVTFNTRISIANKKDLKKALKDAKLVYNFVMKRSKWPRWLDKDFGENRTNLGWNRPMPRGKFIAEIKRGISMFGHGLQHGFDLVCTEKDLKKLAKKLKTTEIESELQDQTHDVLHRYGASFYNACAAEGVRLTRVKCSCSIGAINQDFSTTCCPETLKYSKKAQKSITKAMASVLKKKESVRKRVELEGGEVPEGRDQRKPECGYCGEHEKECECDEFQAPTTET